MPECNISLMEPVKIIMDSSFEKHSPDDVIELYSLGRLPEELVPSFEEHLLVCSRCQDALQLNDDFSATIIRSLKPDPSARGF